MSTITIDDLEFEDLRGSLPGSPDPQPYHFAYRPLAKVKYLVVHHTAGPANQTPEAVARAHIGNGWQGIGYHIWIWPDGRQALVGDLETARAHVAKHNHEAIGFVMPGDFTLDFPPSKQLMGMGRALAAVDQCLWSSTQVVPHRSFGGTACPGDTFQGWWPLLHGYIEGAMLERGSDMALTEQQNKMLALANGIGWGGREGDELEALVNREAHYRDKRIPQLEGSLKTVGKMMQATSERVQAEVTSVVGPG